MTKLSSTLLLAGALTVASGSAGFAEQARRRVPPASNSGDTQEGSRAVPRSEAGARPRDGSETPSPRSTPAERQPVAERQTPPPARQPVAERQTPPSARPADPSAPPPVATPVVPASADQAQPRSRRPRGDNPTTGRAVPRPPGNRPGDNDRRDGDWDGNGRGGVVYAPRPYYYGNRYYYPYYYYPRQYYPYGYGAFGLGYFYYNPYSWYPYGGYAGQYSYNQGYALGIGQLRLDINGPNDAEVFVDGYYAGIVDDFDGIFQSLDLESDGYRIEIRAPGYETLGFDVHIQPGRKTTYRGILKKLP